MTSPNTINADMQAEIDELKKQRDELRINSARYEFLRDRLLSVDFDWNETGDSVLIFSWPANVPVGGNCDMNIDAAIAQC